LHLFKRDKVIAQLLDSLDIPRFILMYEVENCIGPSDPDFFVKYETRRLEQEKIAKAALENSTDKELWELSEIPDLLKSFSLKYYLFDPPPWYAGGFGVRFYKADYDYWSKMDYWTLEEAACLSVGLKPESIHEITLRYTSPYEAVRFFNRRVEQIKRADFLEIDGQDKIKPREFFEWIRKKGIEIPSELDQAFSNVAQVNRPAMLAAVDARKYDSAIKIILGLLSSEYGYRTGNIDSDIKKATMSGLAELGLSLDRKTLNRCFEEAVKSANRFRSEQEKRDK